MKSKYDVHPEIVLHVLGTGAQVEDYLAMMVLFHTHAIELHSNISLNDVEVASPDRNIVISSLTRSHASEVMEQCVIPKRTAEYWHAKYNELTPYESLDELPDALRAKVVGLSELVRRHPNVVSVFED